MVHTAQFTKTLPNWLLAKKEEIQTEVIRKAIHMMAAFVPALHRINPVFTIGLLTTCSILYTYIEISRLSGRNFSFITNILYAASRKKDYGKATLGPITLAFGIIISLILFQQPVSDIAIYALAFGDGLASLAGKMFGRVKIPYSGGKTIAGSTACLIAVFIVSYRTTNRIGVSIILAFFTMLVEVLPSGDLDNIILPVCTGYFVLVLQV